VLSRIFCYTYVVVNEVRILPNSPTDRLDPFLFARVRAKMPSEVVEYLCTEFFIWQCLRDLIEPSYKVCLANPRLVTCQHIDRCQQDIVLAVDRQLEQPVFPCLCFVVEPHATNSK